MLLHKVVFMTKSRKFPFSLSLCSLMTIILGWYNIFVPSPKPARFRLSQSVIFFYRWKMSWDWEIALNNIIISVNTRLSISRPTTHSHINSGEDLHVTIIWWLCLGIHQVLPSDSCSVSEIFSLKRPGICRNYIFSQRIYNLLHMATFFFSICPFFCIFPHPLPLTIGCSPSTFLPLGLLLIGRFL